MNGDMINAQSHPKLQNPIANEMCKIKLKLIIYTS